MKILLAYAVSLSLLACSQLAADAAIVINGSFETPDVPDGFHTNYSAGSNLGGWTVVGVDAAIIDTAFVQNGITFKAQDGR